MALQGNCVYTSYSSSGVTENVTVTRPDGTEITEEREVMVAVSESFSDIYVVVDTVELVTHYHTLPDNTVGKIQQAFVDFAGYTSREARDTNKQDILFNATTQIENFDYNNNTYSQSYVEIKKYPGMENLVDV